MVAFLSKKSSTPRTKSSGHRFRPELNALEDRCLLSVTQTFASGVLTLTGTFRTNVVDLRFDGQGRVTGTADDDVINQSGVNKVVLKLKGGKDEVTFNSSQTVRQNFTLDARLGARIDTFRADLQGGILAGNTLNIQVKGGNGSDEMAVVATDMNIAADAALRLNLNGADRILAFSSNDEITVTYAGQVDGLLDVDTSGGQFGSDVISVDVDQAATSTGLISGRMSGGIASDTLTFKIRETSNAIVNAIMDGGSNSFTPGIPEAEGVVDVGTFTDANVTARNLEVENPL